MDYTTTGLLASIRRRGMLPSSFTNGTADADLLALANEVLRSFVAPYLLDVRENYLQARTPKDYAVTAAKSAYRLPSRAIGNKLREVTLLDPSGNPQNVAEIDQERISDFASSGLPTAFYCAGAYLNLVPTPNSTSGTLRLDYYLRPSELISEGFGTVSASDGSAVLTLTGAISGLLTGQKVDVIKAGSPFDVVDMEQTVTVVGSQLRLADGTWAADIEAGDYVALADSSPVPTIPAEIHPVLAQATACKVLEALGDREGLVAAEAKLQKEMETARTLISPRVDGETEKVLGSMTALLRRGGSARGF